MAESTSSHLYNERRLTGSRPSSSAWLLRLPTLRSHSLTFYNWQPGVVACGSYTTLTRRYISSARWVTTSTICYIYALPRPQANPIIKPIAPTLPISSRRRCAPLALVPKACAIPGEAVPFMNAEIVVDEVPIVLANPGEHSPVRINFLILEDVVPAFEAIPKYPIMFP